MVKQLLVFISGLGVVISLFGMFFAISVNQPALALVQFGFLGLNGMNLKCYLEMQDESNR